MVKKTYPKSWNEFETLIKSDVVIIEKMDSITSRELKLKCRCKNNHIFEKTVRSLIKGPGCKKCATTNNMNNIIQNKRKNVDIKLLKEKIKQKNSNKVELTQKYNSTTIHSNKLKHLCNVCGTKFYTRTSDSSRGLSACPNCNKNRSKDEIEIAEFIKSFNINVITNTRNIIDSELDIYIEKYNLAIEFNGIYWHNEKNKNKNSHLNKYIQCKEKNIRLLQIFEDEWIYKKEIVKNIIKSALNKNRSSGARIYTIQQLPIKETKQFYEKYHIQGSCNGGISYCLMCGDEIMSSMTFSSVYSDRNNKYDNVVELSRFASKHNISGAASRLFKKFIITHQPKGIITYSDHRYFTGRIYEKLKFKQEKTLNIDYQYVVKNKRIHKSNFRKSKLKKILGNDYDENKTEEEITKNLNIHKIWDAGKTLWYWGKVNKISKVDEIDNSDILNIIKNEKLNTSEKISKQSKIMWDNPKKRKNLLEKRKEVGQQPEFKEKMKKITKDRWEQPEFKEKMKKRTRTTQLKSDTKNAGIWVHEKYGEIKAAARYMGILNCIVRSESFENCKKYASSFTATKNKKQNSAYGWKVIS